MNKSYERLSVVDSTERILLLSHCLRPSQTCPGKFDRKGLICPESCEEDCVIARLRQAAISLGYKGVCIAAGGSMALRFVKEYRPRGIVAVACARELEEGVEGVRGMVEDEGEIPAIVVVPLLKDGCVDTVVDEDQAREALSIGCTAGREGVMSEGEVGEDEVVQEQAVTYPCPPEPSYGNRRRVLISATASSRKR
jgi:hypothetical protein